MTYAIIVPHDMTLYLFLRPPDGPMRFAAQFDRPSQIWRHLPISSGLYVIVLAGGDLVRAVSQLADDYYDVVHVPARWFRHLPRSAHHKRAAFALRLASCHRLAPIQYRRRQLAYDWMV